MASWSCAVVFFLLALHTAAAAREFDYFILVRQWGVTFCDHERCTTPPTKNDFTIHGLWPNYNDGTYPQNCDHKNPFNPAALKPLLDRMDSEWPSFAGPDNTFWKHEWDKHGTCAESVFASEFEYFQTTLGLHEQDDLLNALENASITPSSTEGYTPKEVADAIQQSLGVLPLLHCTDGEIEEVWVCFSKDLQLMDCGDSAHTRLSTRAAQKGGNAASCSASIRIPPLDALNEE